MIILHVIISLMTIPDVSLCIMPESLSDMGIKISEHGSVIHQDLSCNMILEFPKIVMPEYNWTIQEVNCASLNIDSTEDKGRQLQSLCVLINNYISAHKDYIKLGTGAVKQIRQNPMKWFNGTTSGSQELVEVRPHNKRSLKRQIFSTITKGLTKYAVDYVSQYALNKLLRGGFQSVINDLTSRVNKQTELMRKFESLLDKDEGTIDLIVGFLYVITHSMEVEHNTNWMKYISEKQAAFTQALYQGSLPITQLNFSQLNHHYNDYMESVHNKGFYVNLTLHDVLELVEIQLLDIKDDLIVAKLPIPCGTIEAERGYLKLYKLDTIPIVLQESKENNLDWVQISLENYIVLDAKHQYYSHIQLADCTGRPDNIYLCNTELKWQHLKTRESCISAVLRNNVTAVQSLCEVKYFQNSHLMTHFLKQGSGRYLLSSNEMNSWSIQCRRKLNTEMKPCPLCKLHLAQDCILITPQHVLYSYGNEKVRTQVYKISHTPFPSIRSNQEIQKVLGDSFESILYNFSSIRSKTEQNIFLDSYEKDSESLTTSDFTRDAGLNIWFSIGTFLSIILTPLSIYQQYKILILTVMLNQMQSAEGADPLKCQSSMAERGLLAGTLLLAYILCRLAVFLFQVLKYKLYTGQTVCSRSGQKFLYLLCCSQSKEQLIKIMPLGFPVSHYALRSKDIVSSIPEVSRGLLDIYITVFWKENNFISTNGKHTEILLPHVVRASKFKYNAVKQIFSSPQVQYTLYISYEHELFRVPVIGEVHNLLESVSLQESEQKPPEESPKPIQEP